MKKLTEEQIQALSKTMCISFIGIVQSMGANVLPNKIEEIRQSYVMDLRNDSVYKSVKEYDRLITKTN